MISYYCNAYFVSDFLLLLEHQALYFHPVEETKDGCVLNGSHDEITTVYCTIVEPDSSILTWGRRGLVGQGLAWVWNRMRMGLLSTDHTMRSALHRMEYVW